MKPKLTSAEAALILMPLTEAADAAVDARRAAQVRLGEAVCPWAIGDIVPCCAYVHEGKSVRIESIMLVPRHSGAWVWQVNGVILKKNLDAGAQVSWTEDQHNAALRVNNGGMGHRPTTTEALKAALAAKV